MGDRMILQPFNGHPEEKHPGADTTFFQTPLVTIKRQLSFPVVLPHLKIEPSMNHCLIDNRTRRVLLKIILFKKYSLPCM
jgi:hypothetical protein